MSAFATARALRGPDQGGVWRVTEAFVGLPRPLCSFAALDLESAAHPHDQIDHRVARQVVSRDQFLAGNRVRIECTELCQHDAGPAQVRSECGPLVGYGVTVQIAADDQVVRRRTEDVQQWTDPN